MSAVHEVDRALLRELAEHRAEYETVLSLYLDRDPSEFAVAPSGASAVRSLIDEAHRVVESGERPHAERQALRAALARARDELEGSRSWAHEARAVALFADETAGLWRLLRLAHPVENRSVAGRTAFIAPLLPGAEHSVCVALVGERSAWMLRGTSERLRELESFEDPVHGRHDQGGWSQARYQRSREESIKAHLRRVGAELHRQLRIAPFERLLIAAGEVLWPEVRAALHPDLRARLGARLVLDVADATVEDVTRAVAEAIDREQREREAAVVERVRERAARSADRDVAVGVEAVLEALVQQRVQSLVFDPRLQVPGVRCRRCGWMAPAGERCPADGGPVEAIENILEPAAEAALLQSAETLRVHDGRELAGFGGIAATLRF
jgi:peptide chain release factor subunit 1